MLNLPNQVFLLKILKARSQVKYEVKKNAIKLNY